MKNEQSLVDLHMSRDKGEEAPVVLFLPLIN
jgi:hypothetical protein